MRKGFCHKNKSFLLIRTSPHLAIIFNITDGQRFCTNNSGLSQLPKVNTKSGTVLSVSNYFTYAEQSIFHKELPFFFFKFIFKYSTSQGTLWRSWLRYCATIRKVAGSIPDGVTGIFHWHNPSGLTMALGLTQPLTEMSTRNISWGCKDGRCVGNRLSWNLGASTSWNPQGLSRGVQGFALHQQAESMANSQTLIWRNSKRNTFVTVKWTRWTWRIQLTH